MTTRNGICQEPVRRSTRMDSKEYETVEACGPVSQYRVGQYNRDQIRPGAEYRWGSYQQVLQHLNWAGEGKLFNDTADVQYWSDFYLILQLATSSTPSTDYAFQKLAAPSSDHLYIT